MTQLPAEFLCPVVNRVDMAWTCVATDDPNPLHLDHHFAVEKAGYQDVVVPGTMLVGWVGEYLEDWAGGIRNLLGWRIRFVAPVWPGEQIKLSPAGMTEQVGDDGALSVRCELTATTTGGKMVARVNAEFRPPAPG